MNSLRMSIVAIASVLLVGCATSPTSKQVVLKNSFDADVAQKFLQKGKNTVEGSALMRQRGGGVVTCAGFEARLFPVTAYASERMQTLYGNTNRGFLDVRLLNSTKFIPDSVEYYRFMKTTICDSQGKFAFKEIADGAFYVVTWITWEVPVNRYMSRQGGSLMQRVTVRGGEAKEIVLSP